MNPRLYVAHGLSAAVLTLALCWCVAYGQEINPVSWSLQIQPEHVAQENRFIVKFKAEIAPGWHLYAMQQEASGPRPLRIALAAAESYEQEAMRAPPPHVIHDANFDAPTQYYEESAEFELPIVKRSTAPSRKLVANIRYQACNLQFCLPPITVELQTEAPL